MKITKIYKIILKSYTIKNNLLEIKNRAVRFAQDGRMNSIQVQFT
jgi:hypothetical protein